MSVGAAILATYIVLVGISNDAELKAMGGMNPQVPPFWRHLRRVFLLAPFTDLIAAVREGRRSMTRRIERIGYSR